MTPKQRKFADEWLIDHNASRAYTAAGYTAKNGNVSRVEGCKLLANPNIFSYTTDQQQKLANKMEITRERIAEEYARLAFSDASRVMTWGPSGVELKDSTLLSEHDRRAVSEVAQTISAEGGSLRLRMHDKKGALDSLAKHLGMFGDSVRVPQKQELPEFVNLGQDEDEPAEKFQDDYDADESASH